MAISLHFLKMLVILTVFCWVTDSRVELTLKYKLARRRRHVEQFAHPLVDLEDEHHTLPK